MKDKAIQLKFRAVNRDIFEAIRTGAKKVETRAATKKFRNIKRGDAVVLVCGKNRMEKQVKKAEIFKTIGALLKKYAVKEINPACATEKELREMYYSFPDYKEKIEKHGLIALELE